MKVVRFFFVFLFCAAGINSLAQQASAAQKVDTAVVKIPAVVNVSSRYALLEWKNYVPDKIEFSIYSRWGNLMFTSKNPNFTIADFTGTKSKITPDGMYYYTLSFMDTTGVKVEYKGNFYTVEAD